MKALYAFLYIFFVWLALPFEACSQNPTKGTMITWIVSQSATILILYLVYKHKMKRWKSRNEADSSDQSLSQDSYSHADREGVIGYETDYSYELEPQVKKKSKSNSKPNSKPAEKPDLVLYVMYYLAISVIMLVVAVNVPNVEGSISERRYNAMYEQGQAEFKEHMEAELPDIIKAMNNKITTVEVSVTDEPLEDYERRYDSDEEYAASVHVYVTVEGRYFEPMQVQGIYRTICASAKKIMEKSCPDRVKYKEAAQEYAYDRYIKLKKVHDGVELKVEAVGRIYKAYSESYDTNFEDDLTEITDELSSTRWFYVNTENYSTYPGYKATTWLSEEEIESRRATEREAAREAEARRKEESDKTMRWYNSGSSSSGKSGSSSKYKETGLDAYDKGYDDVDIDGDYDEYRYEHDSDYASGVDDAMDELDEWY